MSDEGLVRKQHPGFGSEIRALLASPRRADKDLAGIVISEINQLWQDKKQGRPHKNEERLSGDLGKIGYLKLYSSGNSTRAYFTVSTRVLWMLRLTVSKRRTKLTSGERDTLRGRLRDIDAT